MFMGEVVTPSTACERVGGTFFDGQVSNCVMADGITADGCSDILGTWKNDQCIVESSSFPEVCAMVEGIWDAANEHCKLPGHPRIKSRNEDTASINNHMIADTGFACILIMGIVILGLGVVYHRHMAAYKRREGYNSVNDGHAPNLMAKK
jgi:hypothetical protein